MVDRKEVDEQQFHEVTGFLMAVYPNGEKEFPKLVKTLTYIAQTMQAVIDEAPHLFEDTTNHTGVTH